MEIGFLVAAAAVAAVSAITDARTGHIPNWLTVGALAGGPLGHAGAALVAHRGLGDAALDGASSLAGVLCALVPLLLFARGAMGGGDVKLFAAIGALSGFEIGLDVVLQSFVVAAVLAVAGVIHRGRVRAMARNVRAVLRGDKPGASSLTWFRMGPSIFLACGLEVALRWAGG